MERQKLINGLSGLSLAVGVSSWATPRVAGRLFGLDAEANPQAPYLARLFGIRDVALAWGALSSTGSAQRQWLVAGLACDAADAVAGIAGGRAGYLHPGDERARHRHGDIRRVAGGGGPRRQRLLEGLKRNSSGLRLGRGGGDTSATPGRSARAPSG